MNDQLCTAEYVNSPDGYTRRNKERTGQSVRCEHKAHQTNAAGEPRCGFHIRWDRMRERGWVPQHELRKRSTPAPPEEKP